MCGLMAASFGENCKLSRGKRAILAYNLANLADRRGGESWGVVRFQNDDFKIYKGLGPLGNRAYALAEDDKYMAHSRLATAGKVTIKNSHPCIVGNIILNHNGQIFNFDFLNAYHSKDFKVDSMHIADHLDRGLSFNDMIGYGSIVWFNRKNPHKIYLSRLDGGALSVYGIGTHDNVEGVVVTSSWRHMLKALNRSGIKKYFPYRLKTGNVYYIEDSKLYVTKRTLRLWQGRHMPPPIGAWMKTIKISNQEEIKIQEQMETTT